MTSYLGQGYVPVAGKPFGWAWNQERAEIRAHLLARGWSRGDFGLEFRVDKIQRRLNREHKHRWARRIAAWRAQQPEATGASVHFTFEELAHLAEHFAMANDPVAASIAAKAAAAIARE